MGPTDEIQMVKSGVINAAIEGHQSRYRKDITEDPGQNFEAHQTGPNPKGHGRAKDHTVNAFRYE